MLWTVIFWFLFASLAFAFALAIQMRIIIGVVIARALRARDDHLDVRASRLAVVRAGNGETGEEAIDHIHQLYPAQIRQLLLARRVSILAPAGLLILVAVARVL